MFVNHDGKRTSRKVGSEKAALKVAEKIEAKIKLGEFGFERKKPIHIFKEFADIWLKRH